MASVVATAPLEDIVKQQRDLMKEAQANIELVPTGGVKDDKECIIVLGGRSIVIPDIPVNLGLGPIESYPSEWFIKNNWCKPPVTIPNIDPQMQISALKATIDAHLEKSTPVCGDVIKSLLFLVFSKVEQKLSAPWVSLGVIIGKTGEKITPFDLVELKYRGNFETSTSRNEKSLIPLLVLITGCYRIAEATSDSYKISLQNQLRRVLAGSTYAYQIQSGVVSFEGAYYDKDVIKIFAALDMFFTMFPESPYAQIRFGTSVLLYKGCSAFTALAHLVNLVQLKIEDFSRWVFTSLLRKDMYRMNIPHQEISVPHSYTPYMMSFQLAGKCPYSASVNPAMHLFIHLIGCAYGSKRSINALLFKAHVPNYVMDNAYLFIYASVRTGKLNAAGKTQMEEVGDVYLAQIIAKLHLKKGEPDVLPLTAANSDSSDDEDLQQEP